MCVWGIPEGRGKMGGSHMGKENSGTVVPIEIFIFNFQLSKYFTGSNKKLVLSLTP